MPHNNPQGLDEVDESVFNELTEDLVEEWREAFYIFDRDGDGSITWREIANVMRNLGQNPTEEDVKDMIKDVDIDSSGSIDFEEFLYMMTKKMRDTDSEEELKAAFRVFDKDGDGSIKVEELIDVLENFGGKMSREEIEQLVQEGDVEGTGTICYDTSFRLWCPTNERFWENFIASNFNKCHRPHPGHKKGRRPTLLSRLRRLLARRHLRRSERGSAAGLDTGGGGGGGREPITGEDARYADAAPPTTQSAVCNFSDPGDPPEFSYPSLRSEPSGGGGGGRFNSQRLPRNSSKIDFEYVVKMAIEMKDTAAAAAPGNQSEFARQSGPEFTRQSGPEVARQSGPECTSQSGPEFTRQSGPECTSQSGFDLSSRTEFS